MDGGRSPVYYIIICSNSFDPAHFCLLSENDAVILLRARLSSLKEQEGIDTDVHQIMYQVKLSADAVPIRKNHPAP